MKDRATDHELEIIRESLAYAYRFRSRLFVINIDCAVIENQFFPILLKDIATLYRSGIRVILVPGTRERLKDVLVEYGIEQKYYRDLRITDEQSLPFVEMVAFNIANRLMSGLAGEGVRSVIGNWVKAKSRGIIDGVDYKMTGLVEKIDSDALLAILEKDIVPIFPPIGWNPAGRTYNLAAEELALSISTALSADKLFYMGSPKTVDSSGVRIPAALAGGAPERRFSRMTVQEARELLRENEGRSDFLKRIDLAVKACETGVNRVHIVDGLQEGVLLQEIFSNLGIGTMVHTNIFESIRPMRRSDISDVLHIMEPYIAEGVLVPRDARLFESLYNDFYVYDVDEKVYGCAALHPYKEGQGEIAAVAVERSLSRRGIGKRLVLFLLEQARERGYRRVFALTTQTADWFEKLGFRQGSLEDIPVKKRETYNWSRNSKIYLYDL
jgi:amino-acid N-acetyltransferase